MMELERPASRGWLALIGGGEFSFGETENADRAWLARTRVDRAIGFVPTASGSDDYGNHFAVYLDEYFERRSLVLPIYRPRDARRGKNAERISACGGVYLGGGIADQLIDTLTDTPCLTGLTQVLEDGGVVAAIAASAQAMGAVTRSLKGGKAIPGFGWLPGAIDTNFDPGHDRRLRQLLATSDLPWGLGIPAESAVFLGPGGEVEIVGEAYKLSGADQDLEFFEGDLAVAENPPSTADE